MPLAGLKGLGSAGGTRWLSAAGRSQRLACCWQDSMARVLPTGLDVSCAAHRTRHLVCHWQYVTLACIVAHHE